MNLESIAVQRPYTYSTACASNLGYRKNQCVILVAISITHAMTQAGVISSKIGPEHSLELEFDGGRQEKRMDFRPDLPLVFTS